jgi:dihydroorotase (multifunctional complex type)
MRVSNVRVYESNGAVSVRTLTSYEGVWTDGPFDGESVDGTGLLAMAGLIDTHVHFREPGLLAKEGIDNGTKAALAGGVTTILEMPNTVPPCSTPEALEKKRALYGQKSRVHWGLHYQATFPLAPAPGSAVASAKIYMAKSSIDDAVVSEDAVFAVMQRYPRVAVHAEDERAFCAALPAGIDGARAHHVRRPVEAIVSALGILERCLKRLPGRDRPRLILCHAATREELAWVKRLKHEGFDIWAETCPHYMYLTQDDYVRIGNDLKVNPPLRSEADREAVVSALEDGIIDFISTDHAPHLQSEKAALETAPSGIASIECLLPLLLNLVHERRLSMKALLRLCVENPSRCYDVPKRSGLELGNLADLVLLREGLALQRTPTITRAQLHPYLAMPLHHRVTSTWVSGTRAYDAPGEDAAAAEGRGRDAHTFHPSHRGFEVYA